jgi:hypothetical protein
MKKFKMIIILAIVFMVFTSSAIAGPECKSYTMNLDGNVYTLEFSCETAGIGSVLSLYNETEYTQWWLYCYDGTKYVHIAKLAVFELSGNILYHIYYDGTKWYRSGMNFILE